MASKQRGRPRKFGSISSKAANSPSSSTTSSSKPYLETSIDCQSSPASSSVRSKPQYYCSEALPSDAERSKENVTAAVRFRPLSPREIHQGEEVAWYADGETIVRCEHNPTMAYAFDRVFGPTTTTRHVYDFAAHVVTGAMEGINGTIFAYGVTSSGKTHTMHGDQRSPGIIPLAVKDAFSIIQETPTREFLLCVSYLEIYNEVVNDLLNPAGQNLRIREDSQGTFVEGVKEEVVLSPAHALSLIAAGEEHRHVGSTNFNLQSSRSHSLFTLTIESSPCGEDPDGAVNLSQLNLIDLAGSESSKAETTGIRRKEGSYINKSLLTLGTVISKLTDGRTSHIPYRDSKLTRLLQDSLSGHGRVSLICTVTPSSSSSEETHNTLKFAHRAKHIEIQAAQNKITDEKSLIKKYQNVIRSLKEELEQLKRGIGTIPKLVDSGESNIVLLKQKLEDGQIRLQSRLEEEEEAKAALLGRIQQLTKLILVSTKASQSSRLPHRPGPRRRHSFGDEELAYLPYKRRDLILDDENIEMYASLEGNDEQVDDTIKEKKTKKHGILNWLKLRKRESGTGALTSPSDKSSGVKAISSPSTPTADQSYHPSESRMSPSFLAEVSPFGDLLSEAVEDRGTDNSLLGEETPLISMKSIDQIDLLREQQKILFGEVALHSSALKWLSEEAAGKSQNDHIHMELKKLNVKIKVKNEQIALLEKKIGNASQNKMDKLEMSSKIAELMAQLNEKSFELEVKAADNRIIQGQLGQKICEVEGLQESIASLKKQLADALDQRLVPMVTEIELRQKLVELKESKEQLEVRNQKLAEESSYAKGLASAAAVELKALSEEVAKLMSHNERLASELAASKKSTLQRRPSVGVRNGRRDSHSKIERNEGASASTDMKREVALSKEREVRYEVALMEKDEKEAELERKMEEAKQREVYLEKELANMCVVVAKLKKAHGKEGDVCDQSTAESGLFICCNSAQRPAAES